MIKFDRSTFITYLLSVEKSQFKNLNQGQRKELKSIIRRSFNDLNNSDIQKINEINNKLSEKIAHKKNFLIIRIFKGILNRLHFRIKSSSLKKQLEQKCWHTHEYLNVKTDIQLGKDTKDLDHARVILIGETHTSKTCKFIEKNLIQSYGEDSVLLLESLDFKQNEYNLCQQVFRDLNLFNKRIIIKGWEDRTLFNNNLKAAKELWNISESLISQLKKFPQPITKEIFQKNKPIFMNLINRKNLFDIEFDKCKKERDKTLIESVKKVAAQFPNKKILLIAGSLHIEDKQNSWDAVKELESDFKVASVKAKESILSKEKDKAYEHFKNLVNR